MKFRRLRAGWLVLLIVSAVSFRAFGEAEKFSATVSSNAVGVGEQFQVTFSLSGNGSGFRPPSFSDFNVLAGPSQSSQVQIVNGSFSQTLSITYVLQAIKEGTFKIGSAEITAGNNKMLSNTVTITVSKGSGKASGGNAQGKQNNSSDGALSGGKNVFLKANVDKSSPYLGEGIVVTYKLYTKVNLVNYSIDKIPAMSGFWSQDITLPQQLEFHNENVDGVAYKVADVKKLVVFPQRTGNLQLDPMEGEVIARVQVKRQTHSNDPFDQFFNDPFFNNPFFNNSLQDVKVQLKSDPIRISVKELPGGAPASFNGAVGKLNYEVSLDKSETKAHEPVTLKVKVSGKGNIKLIEAPTIEFPPDFESYDPKESSTISATTAGVSGSKTFEFLIIPRNPGDFKIPVASFSYFDLDKKQYQEVGGADLMLKVTKGDENASSGVISGTEKSDLKMLGKDIRFIQTHEPTFIRDPSPFFGTTLFYSAAVAPAFLIALVLFIRRRNQTMLSNQSLLKSQRANRVALKRLSLAKKLLAGDQKEQFLDEMFKALWGFVSDRMQIPVSGLSKESAAQALAERKVPEELILQFNETIDSCEFARFAGSTGESNEVIYQKGINIISKLEQAIRS
ncbi:MAG TPA: BatD family protein [Bacteroidia bacterium]|nr:BatD family protein [Bacteroidia bacterium]